MDLDFELQRLRTGNATEQANAAERLASLGSDAQPAITALVQHCGHADESVRNWCVGALEEVGPPATSQLADLTALAQAADTEIAYWAVTLLGRAGEEAQAAIPMLLQRLQDNNTPAVQERSAWALGQIGRGSQAALAALQSAAAVNGPLATQAQRALKELNAA